MEEIHMVMLILIYLNGKKFLGEPLHPRLKSLSIKENLSKSNNINHQYREKEV